MNKTFLIARREFLSRVQKRTFLLTTIGLPLLIFGFYAMMIYFSVKGNDSLTIAIADNANLFEGNLLKSDDEVSFELVQNQTAATLDPQLQSKKYDGYIIIPSGYKLMAEDTLQLKSNKSIGLITREKIQKIFSNVLEEKRLLALHLSKAKIDSLQNINHIKFATIEGKADSDTKAGISYGVGFVSGFLIYFIL